MKDFLRKKGLFITLLSLLFYAIFAIYTDTSKILYHFSKITVELIPLIILSSFFVLLAKGYRQFILLKALGIELDLKKNFTIYFSGLTMLITPAGIGEFIKSYYLKRSRGNKISETLPFVLMEKVHDFLAMISIITLILFFSSILEAKILVFVFWPIFIISLIVLRSKKLFYRFIPSFGRIKRLERISIRLSNSYESLHKLLDIKTMLKSWSISMVAWILTALSYYLCFVALHIKIGELVTVLLTFTSILFGALSLVPGGIGVVEVSLTGLLVRQGLELSLASAVVLLIRLTGTWFATGLGFIATHSILKISQSEYEVEK